MYHVRVSLRELKRQRVHDALSTAAIRLFLERGFDQVSVAEVAAAAEVSKPTLFKYFASKEDLVLHRIVDHQGEAARIVREGSGANPVDALHRHFRAGLDLRDPVTGLNDVPEVLAYHRMVFATPSLAHRVIAQMESDEAALALALYESARDPSPIAENAESVTAAGTAVAVPTRFAVLAGQIVATQRILARENWRKLSAGHTAGELLDEAIAAADEAFGLLHDALKRRLSKPSIARPATATAAAKMSSARSSRSASSHKHSKRSRRK
jgi:AcrR family transcriptional regulator